MSMPSYAWTPTEDGTVLVRGIWPGNAVLFASFQDGDWQIRLGKDVKDTGMLVAYGRTWNAALDMLDQLVLGLNEIICQEDKESK